MNFLPAPDNWLSALIYTVFFWLDNEELIYFSMINIKKWENQNKPSERYDDTWDKNTKALSICVNLVSKT
jgi:hypothetical protein